MGKFINGNAKEFWGGSILGGLTGGSYVFAQPDLLNTFFIAFVLKLVATGMLAAMSGLATILITDIYKHHIKNKLFKSKEDGSKKDDESKIA